MEGLMIEEKWAWAKMEGMWGYSRRNVKTRNKGGGKSRGREGVREGKGEVGTELRKGRRGEVGQNRT